MPHMHGRNTLGRTRPAGAPACPSQKGFTFTLGRRGYVNPGKCLLHRWAGHETPTLFYLAVFGSFISYIYSAPPLKLKQSGWAGNYALGSSYIALPWLAGQVTFRLT